MTVDRDRYHPVPLLGTPWNAIFSYKYPRYHLYPIRIHQDVVVARIVDSPF
jgi:hypothetical protein